MGRAVANRRHRQGGQPVCASRSRRQRRRADLQTACRGTAPCRTIPRCVGDRAAHYLGELNALHPFREGNGRAQREFVSHLAQASGYYIAWENVTQQDMLEASIQSFKGDTSKLAAIIRENLRNAK